MCPDPCWAAALTEAVFGCFAAAAACVAPVAVDVLVVVVCTVFVRVAVAVARLNFARFVAVAGLRDARSAAAVGALGLVFGAALECAECLSFAALLWEAAVVDWREPVVCACVCFAALFLETVVDCCEHVVCAYLSMIFYAFMQASMCVCVCIQLYMQYTCADINM